MITHCIDVRRGLNPDRRYAAFCRCGWRGPDRAARIEAEHDGDDHVVAASEEEPL